jgi:ATP-dependent Zn protease
MLPSNANQVTNRAELRDEIAILLGGQAAEELIFGSDRRSTGSSQDTYKATVVASHYVRSLGFDGYVGYISNPGSSTDWLTSLDETNATVEQLLKDERARAHTLLAENIIFFKKIVDELLKSSMMTMEEFSALAKAEAGLTLLPASVDYSYHEKWVKYGS